MFLMITMIGEHVAKIIAIANQKGGPGKTTLTMNLAGTLSKRGFSVMVADTDPQGSALRWSASAEEESPFPAVVSGLSQAGAKTHRELQKVFNQYDFILVDCPPAIDSPVPQSVLLVSDLVLLPVIPSPVDLWAAQGIVQLIEQVEGLNGDLQARIIVNQAENTNLSGEVVSILEEFGIPVLSSQLRRRTAYREAALYGSTVHDLGSKAKPAAKEVSALTDEVLSVLEDQ